MKKVIEESVRVQSQSKIFRVTKVKKNYSHNSEITSFTSLFVQALFYTNIFFTQISIIWICGKKHIIPIFLIKSVF